MRLPPILRYKVTDVAPPSKFAWMPICWSLVKGGLRCV